MFDCPNLAVPMSVMQHVIHVESSQNPFAIGVVGGRLARQPRNLDEAVSTANMLEQRGYNFSLGIAQVNRYNLAKYGLKSYQEAFGVCPNIQAGTKILHECYRRANDWGKAFSCYYSGNFTTGYKHGYVQKIFASIKRDEVSSGLIAVRSNNRVEVQPYRVSRVVARYPQDNVDLSNSRYLNDPVPAAAQQAAAGMEGNVGVASVVRAAPQKRVVSGQTVDGAFVF